uniref:Uncharacterized mitochondrial protein AtMg00810-like n=1 Tax=Tanacetum cinerariifolium TaxID=118510 RepID=A0A6L2LTG3_TANCI|nr:uncharacterized mitochondrial protein AtMg00810-like [Tanacetum cinerariifolium]
MDLFYTLLDICTTFTRRVKHLKQEKIAQALKITKLKQSVKKLERRNKVKVLKLRRLQKVGTAQSIDTSDDTVMDDVSNQGRMNIDQDARVGLEEDKDVDADIVKDVISMHEDKSEPAKVQEVVEVVTTAKVTADPSRKRKGVVKRDPKESSPSTIIPAETKSKDKGKEVELNKNIDWDEVIDHVNKKAKEDPAVKKWIYGKIEEEIYVCQPLGFEDLDHPDKVYKVVKALFGLHQAPRAWYKTLANYLLSNGFHRGKIDQTLFIKRQNGDFFLVHVCVDDIIFGSTKKELCNEFERLMKDRFQMSSIGELTFFLGLQIKQKDDRISISQDKYVTEVLRKFNLSDIKTASTSGEMKQPLVKDADSVDVDVHLYRAIIGSLMYLTASRPDIMYTLCRKHKSRRKQRKEIKVPHIEPQTEERVPTPSNDPLPSGLDDQEDASKQGRIVKIDADKDLSLINETIQDQGRMNKEDLFEVHDLDGDDVTVDVTTGKNEEQDATVAEKEVSTADLVTTGCKVVTTAEDVEVTTAAAIP